MQPIPYDSFYNYFLWLNIRISLFSATDFLWFAVDSNETPATIMDNYSKANLKSKAPQSQNVVKILQRTAIKITLAQALLFCVS